MVFGEINDTLECLSYRNGELGFETQVFLFTYITFIVQLLEERLFYA